jgi:hypothetical protein
MAETPRTFNITSICPFDLLRWSKDEFYDVLDQEYNQQFHSNSTILEATLTFIEGGIAVSIITQKREN